MVTKEAKNIVCLSDQEKNLARKNDLGTKLGPNFKICEPGNVTKVRLYDLTTRESVCEEELLNAKSPGEERLIKARIAELKSQIALKI